MAAESDCVFCAVVAGAPHHVVYRDDRHVAFLDHAPVLAGHTLVVPTAHYDTFEDMPDDAIGPFFALAKRISVAFGAALGAEGPIPALNTRISQTVPHVHVHVVPRRTGDGLFSPHRSFWMRQRYKAGEAEQIAEKLRAALS